ncbi:hypothetical protein KF707_12845 [Candidatus Obscuribacterales bacterium]|nr:hypothetical protein [Candidatus Obscuribacterales bacterium]MBX3149158.1 hypothetical protein [Candidatus Obscuribacterales bacterium]
MGKPYTSVRRALLLSLGVSILTSSSFVPAANAFSVLGKKSSSSFDLPCAEKLDGDTADSAASIDANSPDLAPMKLSDPKTEAKTSTTDGAPSTTETTSEGTLNASVTTNTYMPKGPLEGDNAGLLAPTSLKGAKTKDISNLGSGSLSEQARAVNLAPLPLMDSADVTAQKANDEAEIEREQLTGLWEAALQKSPEINFVLNKLMPSSDPAKATTFMMRMLAMAMNGGIAAGQMMMPTPGMYAAGSGASSVLGQLMGMVESNANKKAKLNETEKIMLFNMTRAQADKLVHEYRDYKTRHKSLYKANADFEELKTLALEVRKDGAKELETVYTLKRQQRDIDEIGNHLSSNRKALCDLAGEEAVAKLDASIDDEFKKLHPELITAAAGGEAAAPQPHFSTPSSPDVVPVAEGVPAPKTQENASEVVADSSDQKQAEEKVAEMRNFKERPDKNAHKVAEKPSKGKDDSKPAFKL